MFNRFTRGQIVLGVTFSNQIRLISVFQLNLVYEEILTILNIVLDGDGLASAKHQWAHH